MKYIVEKGANVNAKTKDYLGNTPLHLASRSSSHLEMVKYLIAKGADISAKNNQNKTPLEIAQTECSHCESIIDCLKGKSTSSDIDSNQNSPQSQLEDVSISSRNITRGI